jgi:Flp pilus assembly pilin Flp
MFRKLWNDEDGFIISAELVLVATIVVIGLVVGLTVLRNQVVQELVDVGQAIGSISQSFAFSGTKKDGVAWTDGSGYKDLVDFCQAHQHPNQEPGGISVHGLLPAGCDQHGPPLGEKG